jgi:hypothetical protein
VDFFRGVTIPEANLYPRLFGGQLLGQGLWAACQSVDASLGVHSLHSYFLLPGDPNGAGDRNKREMSFSSAHNLPAVGGLLAEAFFFALLRCTLILQLRVRLKKPGFVVPVIQWV